MIVQGKESRSAFLSKPSSAFTSKIPTSLVQWPMASSCLHHRWGSWASTAQWFMADLYIFQEPLSLLTARVDFLALIENQIWKKSHRDCAKEQAQIRRLCRGSISRTFFNINLCSERVVLSCSQWHRGKVGLKRGPGDARAVMDPDFIARHWVLELTHQ